MNRNKFLSLSGLSFAGVVLLSASKKNNAPMLTDCDDPITPPVPEGPYYKNEKLNRINIAEHKKGVATDYIFRVEDKHCKPVKGAIVDIWQCDSEGHYSDFEGEKTLNQTWLRGYQVTDEKGECMFAAIFPGWYTSRVTHLHVKVNIDSKTVLTTNLFFPKEIENEVYKDPLYPKGPNPFTIHEDYELRDDKDATRHDTLLMKVTKDGSGKLIARYTIAVA